MNISPDALVLLPADAGWELKPICQSGGKAVLIIWTA